VAGLHRLPPGHGGPSSGARRPSAGVRRRGGTNRRDLPGSGSRSDAIQVPGVRRGGHGGVPPLGHPLIGPGIEPGEFPKIYRETPATFPEKDPRNPPEYMGMPGKNSKKHRIPQCRGTSDSRIWPIRQVLFLQRVRFWGAGGGPPDVTLAPREFASYYRSPSGYGGRGSGPWVRAARATSFPPRTTPSTTPPPETSEYVGNPLRPDQGSPSS
jgi:hypothetical protein